MARELYKSKLQEEAFAILGEDHKDITSTKLIKLFARQKGKGVPFFGSDIIMIGPKDSPYVKDKSITTLGIYIVNKFLFEDLKIFGYINKSITGGLINDVDDQLSPALLEDDITQQQLFDYIDRCQWLFGGTLAHIINTSISSTIINLPSESRKLKDKLISENKDKIDRGDPQIASDIEKKVTNDALVRMRAKNDPAIALYDSGCGIDPYNQFKTMFVMKGAVVDNTGLSPTGYKTITSDYDQGITKEDMPKIADCLVTGAYAKGVQTQVGGYSAKRYNQIFQRVRLGPKGSDCGTTKTEDVAITNDNYKQYGIEYRFIMVNGKPVMITPKTAAQYIGKTVKMRTPRYCVMHDPQYCNVCAGDLGYRIEVRNVGQTFNIASNSMLNANMKKFHDVTLKYYAMSEADLLRYDKYGR